MPTDKQIDWLKNVVQGKANKKEDPHKYSVYMNRIREDIDAELERIKWIALNAQYIMKDEEWEVQKFGTLKHRRLIKLLEIVKAIQPESDPILVKLRRETGLEKPEPLI